MVLGTYVAVRWLPGGHGALLGLVNLFVHAFMYLYYFLTSIESDLKRSVWKKKITQVQMVKLIAATDFNSHCKCGALVSVFHLGNIVFPSWH